MAQPLTHSETATLKAALKEKRGPRELREPTRTVQSLVMCV